ncbi:acyltransferase family protein [Streptacidiphilus melanogenes]|uniref:acyltransferase family protein n=1 Tax=Streptacidiphilus melanogenes TaxID=411235 RepID=UPI0005A6815D|nr:acyltransferase [Streptacidiphilus melanogenes]
MTSTLLDQPTAPAAPKATPRPGTARPRLAVLDGLRLLAALAVLSWHWMGVQHWPAIWHGKTGRLMPVGSAIGAYGWLGVELFFLISGFVICMTCWGRTVGEFVTSRVTRLFPAFWVAVLLTSAVLYLAPQRWGVDAHKPTLVRVLTNLTMMPSPVGQSNIDQVYWTLWIELCFYVLFGVVTAFGLTYRRVLAFCGIWGFASIMAIASNFSLLSNLVQADYSWYFIAGIAFFLIHRFGPNLLLFGMVGFCWLMSLDRIQSMVQTNQGGAERPLSWRVAAVVITLSFVLVGAIAMGAMNGVRWRWLTVAGSLTYPLYLVHQEIGFEIINRLSTYLPPYATVAASLSVMLVTAWLLHRLVERPLGPLLKRGMAHSFDQVRSNGRLSARS